nr:hypothetical protein [Mycobacterium sp. UM_NZ2]
MSVVASIHTVSTDDRTYQVVDDLTVSRQALLTGRAIDAAGGPVLSEPVTVTGLVRSAPSDTNRFGAVTGRGGTFALTGRPATVFPGLTATAFDVDVTVTGPGYLTTDVAVHIPAGSALPVPLGDVALHRPGVRLVGQVTRRVGVNIQPVGAVDVVVISPDGLVSLDVPLNFQHSPGDVVTAGTIAPAGAALTLSGVARQGDSQLALATRTGLVVGATLAIGSGSTLEYVVVEGIEGAANLARPGTVRLCAALFFDHPTDAGPVQRVTFTDLPMAQPLTIESPRDGVLLRLAPPSPFPDGAVVRIDAVDPSRKEYRVLRLPRATTDADGRYAVGPVGTALTLGVQVIPPALPQVNHVLRFDRPEDVLDLRVP